MNISERPVIDYIFGEIEEISKRVSRKYFRQNAHEEYKDAISPLVTIADIEIDQQICKLISSHLTHQIISEEGTGNAQVTEEHSWIIDPIDGTIAFTAGCPTFTTLVGYCINGILHRSLVYQPITGDKWEFRSGSFSGSGSGVFSGPQNIREKKTSGFTVLGGFDECFISPEEIAFKSIFKDVTKCHHYGGDGYSLALLWGGFIDIAICCNYNIYDIAPFFGMYESGGILDWHGNPLQDIRNFDGKCVLLGPNVDTLVATKFIKDFWTKKASN